MASEDDERLTTTEYVPRKFIEEYTDPYPKHELVQARAALIKGVCEWSERKGTFKLKEKLGIPDKIDTNRVMFLLQRDQGVTIGPPSYSWKSDRSFEQFGLNQSQIPTYASGTPHQLNASSSGSVAKRKSDNLIVVGEEKRPCPESIGMSGKATAGNLIVVSPLKQEETEVRKRAISPMKVIEPGKSVLNITTVNSSSRFVDKSIASAISIVNKVSSLGSSASDSSSSASAESARPVSGTTSTIKKPPENDFKKEGPESVKNVQITNILKCDYCEHDENVSNKLNMQSHLKSSRHYSASVYGVKKTGNNVELLDVKKKLYVLERSALLKSHIVRCPECGKIFCNVFQCGLHYRVKHCQTDVMEKYALAPVSGIKVAEYTALNITKCLVCNERFDSLNHLNRHEQRRGHFPFENVNTGKNNSLLLFSNSLDKKIAIKNYCLMKAHILKILKRRSRQELTIEMFIHTVQIDKSSVKSLPPLASNSTTLDIVSNDIATWKTIMTFHRSRLIGHDSKKADKKVMAHLKALRDSILNSPP
ncbi:uncharacterized protein LOC135484327 [Lineus longissimus]|uniref:uncharacterized protein LOC135484327 n=1 Tax=Lineus longissimus TaxID=88925 RepID=UPI00315D3319